MKTMMAVAGIRMSVEGFIAVFDRKVPASPPGALPIVTFTRDVTFHLGGEEISVVHVDPAHTDGDAFVRFRKANALHMGDWREMLATIYERVKKSAAAGRSLEDVKAERPTKEWDERFPASFVTSDHVVEEAYRAANPR
jgi:hypothetical protein